MNVLLVNISLDAQLGGGTAERTRHLAIHLTEAGCHCEVVAMTGNSWRSEFEAVGVKSYITGRIGRRFSVPLINPLRAWRSIRAADVVHVMGYWNLLSISYGVLAILAGRRYVLCPAGEFASLETADLVKKAFHCLLGQWLIKWSSGFIAITELERYVVAEIANISPASVLVVPNAVSEPVAIKRDVLQELPENQPFIMFMGRLALVKGPDFLVQAYIDSPSLHCYPLVMAGPDFGMRAQLQAQVDAAGLTERVRFIGYLDEVQRTLAYRKALLLVIPSRSEAMSLVALEAGIVGLPVLLTDTCGFDQIQSIGGGMVVSASSEGIAQGMQLMLADLQELKLKGDRLQAYVVKNYTWTATVKTLIDFFGEIVRAGWFVKY